MGTPTRTDGQESRRVTITLPKELLDLLLEEVPFSKPKSLSGLIAQKISARHTGHLIPDNQITVFGKLRDGAKFADVLKQLESLDGFLKIVSISGNLDLSGPNNSSVEVIIASSKP